MAGAHVRLRSVPSGPCIPRQRARTLLHPVPQQPCSSIAAHTCLEYTAKSKRGPAHIVVMPILT